MKKRARRLKAIALAAVLCLSIGTTTLSASAAMSTKTFKKKLTTTVTKQTKKAKTKKAKLKALFTYVKKNYDYGRVVGFKATKTWPLKYAKEMLTKKQGSCYHYAALYAYLAKKATGYPTRVCVGTTNGFNKSRWQPHAWCEVKIGKNWYICDPNMDKYAAKSSGKYYLKNRSKLIRKTYKVQKMTTIKL